MYLENLTVIGTANVEVVAALISGTTTEKKKVRALWVTELTGTLQHDAVLRVYLNTVRLLDFPLVHTLLNSGDDDRPAFPRIALELDLLPGDTLYVGQVSGATASDVNFAVEYDTVK